MWRGPALSEVEGALAREEISHGFAQINTDKKQIRENPCASVAEFFVLSKGVNELQFQIKGQDYFLAFVEREKRWYVFSPTAQGINRFPVYVDAVKYEKLGALVTETTLSS